MTAEQPQMIPQAATLEEAQLLINDLWLKGAAQSRRMEEMAKRIEELEEKLGTNSRNSSKPPSTEPHKAPNKKSAGSGKKAGGQPGHQGKGRALFTADQITHIQSCYPNPQCDCGSAVRTTHTVGRHQTIDIPEIKPRITEYRRYAGTCQGCGKPHEGRLPAGVSAKLVGPRLLALIGTLTGGYRLSKRLVQGLLQDVFRIDVSVGVISQSEAIISAALDDIVQEAHEHIRQAPVVHSDETGHKEKGKKQWMWVAIAGLVSVFMARASRSAEMARELLGETFTGILVSDRYAAYTWVDAARRQLCWAHLLRDFTRQQSAAAPQDRLGSNSSNRQKECSAIGPRPGRNAHASRFCPRHDPRSVGDGSGVAAGHWLRRIENGEYLQTYPEGQNGIVDLHSQAGR